jgi:hypothetical protein
MISTVQPFTMSLQLYVVALIPLAETPRPRQFSPPQAGQRLPGYVFELSSLSL